MKRLLGGLLECVQVLGMALLCGVAALLARLAAIVAAKGGSGLSRERAGRLLDDIVGLVSSPARGIAVAALVAAVLAPYVRDDARKLAAWLRAGLVAAALAILIHGWSVDGRGGAGGGVFQGDAERHADLADALHVRRLGGVTPWTALLGVTGANLALAAFLVFSGGKAAKPKGKAKEG